MFSLFRWLFGKGEKAVCRRCKYHTNRANRVDGGANAGDYCAISYYKTYTDPITGRDIPYDKRWAYEISYRCEMETYLIPCAHVNFHADCGRYERAKHESAV